jgi:hypothetical protein
MTKMWSITFSLKKKKLCFKSVSLDLRNMHTCIYGGTMLTYVRRYALHSD